jgi:uncharacterized protein YybS (DUF2232 family)
LRRKTPKNKEEKKPLQEEKNPLAEEKKTEEEEKKPAEKKLKEQPYMSVNAQVEGAFMAAFSVIIGLISLIIPFLMLVGPVPAILLVLRRGIKAGFLATFVAGCVFSIFAGFREGIVFVLLFNLFGLVIGLGVKAKWSAGKILLAGIGVYFIVFLLSILCLPVLTGMDVNTMMKQMDTAFKQAEEMQGQILEAYKTMGFTKEQLAEATLQMKNVSKTMKKMTELMMKIMIAGFAASSYMMAFLQYIIAQKILKRLGYILPPFPSFSCWRLPWYFSWFFISGFTLFLTGEYKAGVVNLNLQDIPNNYYSLIGTNILFIILPLYFIIGISIIVFFMNKFKLTLIWRILIIYLLLITGNILYFIGLFDTFADFRGIERIKEKDQNSTLRKTE